MKKRFLNLLSALAILLYFAITNKLSAQGPPAPPSNGHSQTTNQQPGNTGGSAPLGSGLGIMLLMGAAWAGRKILKKKD